MEARTVEIEKIIKVPLWPLTVFSTIALGVMFLLIGYFGCTLLDDITCKADDFPMISDILRHKYFDRVYIFAMVFHASFVQFSNIRAYYSKFSEVIDSSTNDRLFWAGLVACICQPMVGMVDNKMCNPVHTTFAVSFFVLIIYYFFVLLGQIYSNGMHLLTPGQQSRATFLYYFRWVMLVFLVVTLACNIIYGTNVPTPYLEWSGTLLLINFFTVTALLDDDYMEMVGPANQLAPLRD